MTKDPGSNRILCGVLEVVIVTPTLLTPDSSTCTDKSAAQIRAERFLASVPALLRADFQETLRLWARDRDSAGQVIDDLVARLKYELPRVGASPRRADLKRLQHLLQADRYAAILLVGRVKAGAS
jgi:hypothetical protein